MATYRKFRDIDYGKPIIAPTHGDTVAPQNDLAAAAWLPIDPVDANIAMGFHSYDYQRHVFTDKVVIMPGKLVALTRESLNGDNSISSLNQGTVGRLVPAGVRLAWKAAGGSATVLTYTAADVAERIEDLGTGKPVTGAKSYTKTNLTLRLQERGLLGSSETLDAFISRPIGVAANVVYAWAGGDGTQPDKLRFMNYRRENKSTFWTGQDHTLRLPVAPAKLYSISALNLTVDADASASWDGTKKLVLLGDGTGVAAASAGSTLSNYYHGADFAKQATYANVTAAFDMRYADLAANANAKVIVLGHQAIESNIYNTIEMWEVVGAGTATISKGADLTSTWLSKEKTLPSGIKAAGDYFVDRDLGLLFVHTDCPVTGDQLIAFRLAATAESYSGNVFAAVGKAVKPGDYLTYDKYSNFVPYVARTPEVALKITAGALVAATTGDLTDAGVAKVTTWANPTGYQLPEDIVGKCYTLDRSPKADLAAVKTFHDYEGVSLADRTPGSANDGHPAEIHQSLGGQFAAIVRVLL